MAGPIWSVTSDEAELQIQHELNKPCLPSIMRMKKHNVVIANSFAKFEYGRCTTEEFLCEVVLLLVRENECLKKEMFSKELGGGVAARPMAMSYEKFQEIKSTTEAKAIMDKVDLAIGGKFVGHLPAPKTRLEEILKDSRAQYVYDGSVPPANPVPMKIDPVVKIVLDGQSQAVRDGVATKEQIEEFLNEKISEGILGIAKSAQTLAGIGYVKSDKEYKVNDYSFAKTDRNDGGCVSVVNATDPGEHSITCQKCCCQQRRAQWPASSARHVRKA